MEQTNYTDELHKALRALDAAQDWLENQDNWTKDVWARIQWKAINAAKENLRNAYFTTRHSLPKL